MVNCMRRNDALLLTYIVGKSTAFVIPILPIYLFHQGNFSIQYMLHVASFYVLVPVLLDIPLGFLSDKVGYKPILIIGTLLFLTAFLGIAYIAPYSYHIYILGISLAAACYSGCEPLFIKSLISNDEHFSTYYARLNEKMYIITAAFLVAGGFAYQLAPVLPIVIQIGCLLAALVSLLLLPATQPAGKKNEVNELRGDRHALPSVMLLALLAIATLSNGLFTGITQLNSRTVQIQIDDLLGGISAVAIGGVFACGNLASSWGSKFYRASFAKRENSISLLISIIFALISCLLFTFTNLTSVVLAFFVFSFFKGFYRPAVNSALVDATAPYAKHATVYSAANVLSVAIAAIIHYAAAFTFRDLSFMYLLASIVLGITLFGPIFLWFAERNFLTEVFDKGFSSKRHFVRHEEGQPIEYVQKYSKVDTSPSRLSEIYTNMRAGYLPAPEGRLGRNLISMEYVAGPRLSECDAAQQLRITSHLLSRMVNVSQSARGAAISPDLREIFREKTLQVLSSKHPLQLTLIHGDLHPDNILVRADAPVVIDWDHSGAGDRIFDALTLITSPLLRIGKKVRLELIASALALSDSDAAIILHEFTTFKHGQLLALNVPELRIMAQAYLTLQTTS